MSSQVPTGFTPRAATKSNTGMIIAIIVVLLLIGGGAAYYFLIYKKSKVEEDPPAEEAPPAEEDVAAMEVASGAGGTGTGGGGGSGGTAGASSAGSGGTATPSPADVPPPPTASPYSTMYDNTSCFAPSEDLGYLGVVDINAAQTACNNNSQCGALTQHEGGDFWMLKSDNTRNSRQNSKCWRK